MCMHSPLTIFFVHRLHSPCTLFESAKLARVALWAIVFEDKYQAWLFNYCDFNCAKAPFNYLSSRVMPTLSRSSSLHHLVSETVSHNSFVTDLLFYEADIRYTSFIINFNFLIRSLSHNTLRGLKSSPRSARSLTIAASVLPTRVHLHGIIRYFADCNLLCLL